MAEDVVIRAEGLGRKYLIGHQAERYVALRDVLVRGAQNLWRKTVDMAHGRAIIGGDAVEEFWALRDVNFEVKRGEVLGIIGRNGAGKSTLLKILSRITEPSEGRVTIRGRVASLLEVGTGFHPELTGRENIYLNGAILGMTRGEIRRKFDEIVAFAEVEKFLDTPAKRYSSGMYVRLAFAVAAHLEPEILVVDEVLAVGDAEFQKKCLGKMDEVSRREGRTVLLVSHNPAAIRHLCDRAVVLDNGKLAFSGNQHSALQFYHESSTTKRENGCFNLRYEMPGLSLITAKVFNPSIRFGEGIAIETKWLLAQPMQIAIECILKDRELHPISFYGTGISSGYEIEFDAGENCILIEFPALPLAEGAYTLDIAAAKTNKEFLLYAENVASFIVEESDPLGTGMRFVQGNGSAFFECRIKSDGRRRSLLELDTP